MRTRRDVAERMRLADRTPCAEVPPWLERHDRRATTEAVTLHGDLRAAGTTDDLGATVDSRGAARLVVEIGSRAPVKLMESVASQIADALLERLPVEAARVRIRKFSSPAPGVAGTIWIELFRDSGRQPARPGSGTPVHACRRRRAG